MEVDHSGYGHSDSHSQLVAKVVIDVGRYNELLQKEKDLDDIRKKERHQQRHHQQDDVSQEQSKQSVDQEGSGLMTNIVNEGSPEKICTQVLLQRAHSDNPSGEPILPPPNVDMETNPNKSSSLSDNFPSRAELPPSCVTENKLVAESSKEKGRTIGNLPEPMSIEEIMKGFTRKRHWLAAKQLLKQLYDRDDITWDSNGQISFSDGGGLQNSNIVQLLMKTFYGSDYVHHQHAWMSFLERADLFHFVKNPHLVKRVYIKDMRQLNERFKSRFEKRTGFKWYKLNT